jgi:HprK-related kinase A
MTWNSWTGKRTGESVSRSTAIANFQIGIIPISLRSSPRFVLRQYRSLYGDFENGEPGPGAIPVRIERSALSWKHRWHFTIMVDNEVRYRPTARSAVLPHIEWALSWQLFDSMPSFLQIHAATLSVQGVGAMFAGHAGSGKSTLTIGLLANGWRYLCDEFALICPRTLQLQPYPRAICAKEPSFSLLSELGVRLHEDRRYSKGAKGQVGFVKASDVRPGCIAAPCRVGLVFFPRYVPGAEPTAIPVSRAEAALKLHEYCFNLRRCTTSPVDVLARIVRQASCYRLIVGDLTRTCRLLNDLAQQEKLPKTRIA